MRRIIAPRNAARVLLNGERGASMVEFAIILPLLLLLVFGMTEFGLILYNKQVITNASREGARYAIVQPSSSPWHSTGVVQQVVTDYCSDKLISFGGNSVTVAVKDASNGSNLSSTQNVCSVAASDKDIEIQVTYNYQFLVFHNIVTLFSGSQNSTLSISASTTMRCEASS